MACRRAFDFYIARKQALWRRETYNEKFLFCDGDGNCQRAARAGMHLHVRLVRNRQRGNKNIMAKCC